MEDILSGLLTLNCVYFFLFLLGVGYTFVTVLLGKLGHIDIPGVATGRFEPIKNPVTGKPHHAMIRLYSGFEFHEAEMASATAKGTGAIQFDFADRYAFLIDVTYGPHGLIA